MRKGVLSTLVCLLLSPACEPSKQDASRKGAVSPGAVLTDAEQRVIQTLSPLPAVPADPTNRYADDARAALLGQKLFFEKSYSGPLSVGDDGGNGGLGKVGDRGKVACHSCHGVGGAPLDDQRSHPNSVSLGTDFGPRNAIGLLNSAFGKWTNWGGRFDSQWSLPLSVAENPKIMKSTRLDVVHMLWNKYRTEYNALFPVALDPALDPAAADAARFPASGKPKAAPTDPDGAWEGMAPADREIVNTIYVNFGKALQAYIRKLISRNAPFDRFVAGDRGAISAAAVRGLRLFVGKALCIGCHRGPTFSDDAFHATGVPQSGPHVPPVDLGRFQDVPALLSSPFNSNGPYSDDRKTGKLQGLSQQESQRGQFRTKSLRNIVASGPYMHAGQLATLSDVMHFYKVGGGDVKGTGIVKDPIMMPLDLTAQDEADLVEFVQTLSGGDPLPASLLADTSK